jgi:hypothetical protein
MPPYQLTFYGRQIIPTGQAAVIILFSGSDAIAIEGSSLRQPTFLIQHGMADV